MSAAQAEAEPPAPRLWTRRFLLLWSVRFAAILGSQIQGAAIGWQVYETARRSLPVPEAAFALSLLGLVQFLPLFALILPAGEMADRRDRRGIVIACLVFEAVGGALLLFLSLGGRAPLWALFAIAGLFGAARAFIAPASTALLPMVVDRINLPRAIVMSSLAFLLGAIAGPGLGGVLVGLSAPIAYGAATLLFVAAALAGASLTGDFRPPSAPEGSRWALMREGLVFVWRTRVIFGAISLDLVAVLLGGATLLMPAFARDILKVGPEGFGLMRAAPAVGAAVMALWLARFAINRRAGLWMFTGVAVFGAATVVFGLSRNLGLTLAALAVLGAADMISVNIRQTLIQVVTPDAMRGRVSAVSMLFISASNELGEFESGLVARFLGPVGAAVFGGLGSLAATGVWAAAFPQLRRADRLAELTPREDEVAAETYPSPAAAR